jgi:acyl-coenzyme A synthetase/AMP-(fatty) acid ligase
MPVYFWNDTNGEKYKSAYFSTYNGVWAHGDYVSVNSVTGGVVMLGRRFAFIDLVMEHLIQMASALVALNYTIFVIID